MSEAVRRLAEETGQDLPDELWKNDRYVVIVRRDSNGFVAYLSIRRSDRKAARDWRDFQAIKDQLAGEDVEAVELYPAKTRLVDTANHYWLWMLPPGARFPLGFPEGLVLDSGEGPFVEGVVQRPISMAAVPGRGQ